MVELFLNTTLKNNNRCSQKNKIIGIYCIVDDILKWIEHTDDLKEK